MADDENVIPSSKKRAAGREISKDNPGLDDDDENASEQELGTFKKASDEVLASRRIVKVRRQTPSAPSSNPFAGIRLVPPKAVSDTPNAALSEVEKGTEDDEEKGQDVSLQKVEKELGDGSQNNDTKEGNGMEKKEIESQNEKVSNVAESDIASEKETVVVKDSSIAAEGIKSDVDANEVEECGDANKIGESDESQIADVKVGAKINENSSGGASNLNPFQQLSGSKNAFTGFAGTGFSGSAFSFNPISNDGTAAGADSVPPTGQKTDQPFFSFGISVNNGNGSLFGTKDNSFSKSETSGATTLQEVPTETGEENETAVFAANSALFEYIDGGWKERGRGEVKVNVSTFEGSKARLVMRTKGNYRLILNASLYPEMKLTQMDKKGITFACINSNGEGKGSLSTYALKFRDGSVADEFHAVVESHKSTPAALLKTPENSPQ
uniref:RanBD1 domain-containing protein n=1 Tax=Kalanchoe fedtschenkoi TaxID=63787 RepID=A0A7N0UYV1_KALFE